jgi:hypothetical protein
VKQETKYPIISYDFAHFVELSAGPTTSEVNFLFLHTDAGVTECQYHTAVFASALTFAGRESTGGCRGIHPE